MPLTFTAPCEPVRMQQPAHGVETLLEVVRIDGQLRGDPKELEVIRRGSLKAVTVRAEKIVFRGGFALPAGMGFHPPKPSG